ncbi:hypothetical protein AB0H65_27535 [Streptomyces griseoaurantiacus]|uniref:hypothetical protein n=1 Tax=Streptomyces griseoaurantiacus TaxID=68213 RepID=UPI00345F75EE
MARRQIKYFFDSPVAQQVREEGRVEGREEERARMVVSILEWRGIEVPDIVREMVDVADMDILDHWAERAVHPTSLNDVMRSAPRRARR